MLFIIFHIFLLLSTAAVDYAYNQSYHKLCHEIESKITRKLRKITNTKKSIQKIPGISQHLNLYNAKLIQRKQTKPINKIKTS